MSPDWLMVVDMQPAFSHPDSPWFTPGTGAAGAAIGSLLPLFGSRVLFTRFVPPARPAGSWVAYYERWPWALDPASAWLWELDAPWQSRNSIASHTFSKWVPAAQAAVDPGAGLVLCGVSTDCCVLMTALAAVDDGRRVRVVADACAARTPTHQARALELLAGRAPQLAVVTAAEERARHA